MSHPSNSCVKCEIDISIIAEKVKKYGLYVAGQILGCRPDCLNYQIKQYNESALSSNRKTGV